MRVVSVGVPVEELLKNKDSDLAVNTAVEFCGGTYAFVIMNSDKDFKFICLISAAIL